MIRPRTVVTVAAIIAGLWWDSKRRKPKKLNDPHPRPPGNLIDPYPDDPNGTITIGDAEEWKEDSDGNVWHWSSENGDRL